MVHASEVARPLLYHAGESSQRKMNGLSCIFVSRDELPGTSVSAAAH